jgi:ribosomal protein S18 acetylase RimI-like enzyme
MPSLRPYELKDWPHFLALDLETAGSALVAETSDTERARLHERWPTVLALRGLSRNEGLLAPNVQLWVIEADAGSYLGHLWLTEKHDGLASERVLEVTTMAIVREARGEGLGRVLMQKAEAEAKARGIVVVELSVAGNNRRARDLYRDLGYDTTSRTMRKKLHP